jgi:hypothetical protein
MSTAQLYRFHDQPLSVPAAVLRPFLGGPDVLFNTRDRDVIPGVTKPSASNTGILPGSTLIPVTGDLLLTSDTVLENLDIHGRVTVRTANVILRNCKIHVSGAAPVQSGTGIIENTRAGNSVVPIDCEIYSDTPDVGWIGVYGSNITAIRCNIHDVVDHFDVFLPGGTTTGPTNTLIQSCWLHDYMYVSPDPNHPDNGTHNDGLQISNGDGTTAVGNFIDMTQSISTSYVGPGGHASGPAGAGLTITPLIGPVNSFTFDRNWFDHGARAVHGIGSASFPITGGSVINNRMGANIAGSALPGDATVIRRTIVFPNDANNILPGLPAVTGPDVSGNIDEATGLPTTVWRANP